MKPFFFELHFLMPLQGICMAQKHLFVHEKMTFLKASHLNSTVAPCCIFVLCNMWFHILNDLPVKPFHTWGQYIKSYNQISMSIHRVRICVCDLKCLQRVAYSQSNDFHCVFTYKTISVKQHTICNKNFGTTVAYFW